MIVFDAKENSSNNQSEEYCDQNLKKIKQGGDTWQMDKIW